MKVILALALFVVIAAAIPAEPSPAVFKILRSEFDKKPEGGYVFDFETENGISRSETGEVKSVVDAENKPQEVVVVRGSYSYTNPDGSPESVNYFADETGYHAEGSSIPKSPSA